MAKRKKAKSFLGKFGGLIAVIIAVLSALTIILPGLILKVENADPTVYKGFEFVFGKEIAGAGIGGFGGDVSIPFSILGVLGYFLPVVLSVLVALIVKNRQLGGMLLLIAFVFGAAILFVMPEITHITTTIKLGDNVSTTAKTFAQMGYKLDYGTIIGGSLNCLGALFSVAYSFSK